MSVTNRIAGSTGKHHSFWAMYSLRMSVWIVPPRRLARDPLALGRHDVEREHHRRRRVDRHRHGHLVQRNPVEQRLHVGQRVDRHALAPDLAQRAWMVGVVAHQRGHVERGREAGLAVIEQVVKAPVGLGGVAEAGELAHRPQTAAVHRSIDTARVRVLAGQPDRRLGIRGEIGLGVQRLDRLAGDASRTGRRARGRGRRSHAPSARGRSSRGVAAMLEVYGHCCWCGCPTVTLLGGMGLPRLLATGLLACLCSAAPAAAAITSSSVSTPGGRRRAVLRRRRGQRQPDRTRDRRARRAREQGRPAVLHRGGFEAGPSWRRGSTPPPAALPPASRSRRSPAPPVVWLWSPLARRPPAALRRRSPARRSASATGSPTHRAATFTATTCSRARSRGRSRCNRSASAR